MTESAGFWIAIVSTLLALRGWWMSRVPVRHDAVVLLAIFAYFSIGTLDLGITPTTWNPRLSVNPEVWTAAGVGALSYFLGAIAGRRLRVPDAPLITDALLGGAWRASRLLLIVGGLGLVALTIASRAPLITGANREVSSGYLTTLALLVIPAVLLRLAVRSGAWQRRDWLLLVIVAAFLLMTNYRTYTLMLGLTASTLAFLDAGSGRRRWSIVLGGVALVLLIGMGFGYLRFARFNSDQSAQLVQLMMGSVEPTIWRAAVAYIFFGFFREGVSLLGFLLEQHPALTPFTHGRALLGTLTAPLPGVQLDARAIVSIEVYGSEQTSLVSSIFGPWYLDFGYAGIVVAMCALGMVLSWLEKRALWTRDPFSRAAFAYALIVVLLGIHTGLVDFTFLVAIPAAFIWASRHGSSATPEAVSKQ